ncbi:hypothetical protein V7O66_00675 [Methanolobus sp. ZRKC3]|uniref:hypothetical protein n=1 Tax=Methanolobus sp. ZRKC3 TaxID=3125786 RepID=UPI00325680AD
MTDGVNADGKNDVLNTFEKDELIEKVADKHRRFINEYSSEFAELESKMNSLNEIIVSSTAKKEDVLNRIDILTEKRQLFYHQAEKQFDDLKAKLSGNPDISKELSSIYEMAMKLKGSLNPDEEKERANSTFEKLSSIDLSSDLQNMVASINAKINDAIASNVELHSIKGTDGDFDKEKLESEGTISEIGPRHSWLKNRINSHKEALNYWENVSKGQDAEVEVKA